MLPDIRPGDIFASSGLGIDSSIIRLATFGYFPIPVSHVGKFAGHPKDLNHLLIWESTTLSQTPCAICGAVGKDANGLHAREIEPRLQEYRDQHGKCYMIPLTERDRWSAPMHKRVVERFLMKKHGTGYDLKQALLSGTLLLRMLPIGNTKLDRVFCSEVACESDKWAGLMQCCNSSAMNPARYIRTCLRLGMVERPVKLGA